MRRMAQQMDSGNKLGNKIKDARKKSGRSQVWLAQKLDVCRSSVARWESGETTPTTKNLKIISDIFEVNFLAEKSESKSYQDITEQYRQDLEECHSVKAVYKVTQDYMSAMDIDYFLYMQVFRGDLHASPKFFVITDIDVEWQQYYATHYLSVSDPVWSHCWNSVVPIYSDDIYKKAVKSNDKIQKEIFQKFWGMGYAFYVAIPIHGPCCMSTFSVTVKSREKVPMIREVTPLLTYAGQLLYENIHRIFGEKFESNKRPHLRSVDHKLMSYLVQGVPLKDIAIKFNISESAVRQRIDRLKIKLGVENRQELCLQVVAQGVPLQSMFNYTATGDVYESHGLRGATF